jgi:hypothetical protein
VISACGQAVKAPAGSPSASPASATSTASAGNTSGTLACRLPLAQPVPPPDNAHRSSVRGAFVNFPAGDLSIDPNGAFVDAPDRRLKSVAQPSLYGGAAGATYTKRYGRWLPASVATVSPDSSHYAYWEFTFTDNSASNSRVHVVEVTSGADRIIYSQGFYMVIDYESEGIYLAQTSPMGEGYYGLWLLDPVSASLRAVAPPDQMFYLVGGGAAWRGDVAPGDQAPAGMFPMTRVLRFDLKSRVAAEWFRRPGMQVQAMGFDGQGHPVVMASSEGSTELWLVSAPGVGRQIYSGPGTNSPDYPWFSSPLADSHGIWFGSSKGVFLYTPDGKLQKVSTATGDIAGRCS